MYARKGKTSARPALPAPCRLGRECAVFRFLLVAVGGVTAAHALLNLQCFVSDNEVATLQCCHHRRACHADRAA
jgi:hypothetical protein